MGKILSTISDFYLSHYKQEYTEQLIIENEISQRAIEKIEHDDKWMIEKYTRKPTKYNPYHFMPIEIQSDTFNK